MIDNTDRAAVDAIYTARDTLERIDRACQRLATQHPTAPAVTEWHDLAGEAWTAREDAADLLEARTLDGRLPAAGTRQWLRRAEALEKWAKTVIP